MQDVKYKIKIRYAGTVGVDVEILNQWKIETSDRGNQKLYIKVRNLRPQQTEKEEYREVTKKVNVIPFFPFWKKEVTKKEYYYVEIPEDELVYSTRWCEESDIEITKIVEFNCGE